MAMVVFRKEQNVCICVTLISENVATSSLVQLDLQKLIS